MLLDLAHFSQLKDLHEKFKIIVARTDAFSFPELAKPHRLRGLYFLMANSGWRVWLKNKSKQGRYALVLFAYALRTPALPWEHKKR